ncbi:MAG: NAD(P)-dependent oxidoreductase [Candidatus Zixiibacteriota bacterium]
MIGQEHRHVLVVGGAGYIGSVLCGVLLDRGWRVRVLDALLYDNSSALDHLAGHSMFSLIKGDLRVRSDTQGAMEEITDVVLLAALVGDPICRKYPDLARQINETGTLEFIDSLGEYSIKRLVFMSTCSNYGLRTDDQAATEESELNPKSLYAETKVKVERYLLSPANRFNLSVTVLRAATAYGISPRMRFDLTVNEFTRELALGRELLVYDSDTWRPYCHVTDIAEIITQVLAADSDRVRGQVFNVGSTPENYTKKMLVDLLLEHFPTGKVRYQSGTVDPRNYRVSFEKLRTVLGVEPGRRVRDSVPELIRQIREGRFASIDGVAGSYGNYSLHR